MCAQLWRIVSSSFVISLSSNSAIFFTCDMPICVTQLPESAKNELEFYGVRYFSFHGMNSEMTPTTGSKILPINEGG